MQLIHATGQTWTCVPLTLYHCTMAPFIIWQLTMGYFSGVIGILQGCEEMSQTWRPCHLCCTPRPCILLCLGSRALVSSGQQRTDVFSGHHRVNISSSTSPVPYDRLESCLSGRCEASTFIILETSKTFIMDFKIHNRCALMMLFWDWLAKTSAAWYLKICSVGSGVCACVTISGRRSH